jgi:RND family efflux transporter MFP subunit
MDWGRCPPRRAAGAALGVIALLTGCGEQNTYVPPPPPKVTVAPPAKHPVTRYLESTGNVASVDSTDLVARVTGFIEAIKYDDGDFVKKGALLFVIEQKPYELKVESAKATEESARASLVKAQAEYDRQAELLKTGSGTRSKLDDATGSRDSAKASLDSAIASRKLAENDYSYTTVTAPFDGIVSARKVSVGAYVGTSNTVLASIVRNDPIYVNFTISEQDALNVRAEIRRRGLTPDDLKKVPVEIGLQTDDGYPHQGTLNYASPTLDSKTGTLAARAIFDNTKQVLLPGMFVRVRVPLGPPVEAMLVPDTALGIDQSGRYLLTVNKDNVVEQHNVEVGPLDGAMRVIEKGISAGDRVIVNGIQRAIPGQKVDPQAASATPPKS